MNIFGYYKEYYRQNKYIGKKVCDKDRNDVGYIGKQNHIADIDIKFGHKRIKKGEEYMTMLYPLCGR